jgi:hypothetical protein
MGRRRRKNKGGNPTKAKPTPAVKMTYEASIPKSWSLRNLLKKLGEKGVAALSIVASVLGLLTIYVLRPDVSIEPYATIDPTRPFQQQFSVQNNSVYSIHKVQPLCGFDEDSNIGVSGLSLGTNEQDVETLEPGAKTTLACSITTGPIRQELNFVPWVKYKILFGIPRCKAAKFKGKPAHDGTYIWTYNGSSDC